MPWRRFLWCFWAKSRARLIFKLSSTATVIEDGLLCGDKALLGNENACGDGLALEAIDDGVITRISLIGVAAEASAIVPKLEILNHE